MDSPIACRKPRVFITARNDLKSLRKSEMTHSATIEEWETGTEECPASPLLFTSPHSNSHQSKMIRFQEHPFSIPTSHSLPMLYLHASSPRIQPAWKAEAALRLVATHCPLSTLTALMLVNRSIGRSREIKRCFRLLLCNGLLPATRSRYWHQTCRFSSAICLSFRPLSLCSRDIINDTIRTPSWNSPQFPLFQQSKMIRVLDAVSTSNANIGYCQGMNYVAGVIVQVMEKEEDCYWMLSSLLWKYKLGNLYKAGLKLLKLRCYQLDCLLQDSLPVLAAHLRAIGLHAKVYAARWFLTLLSCDLSSSSLLVMWDLFLQSGWKVLFRVMLAMLASVQQQLLASDTSTAIDVLTSIGTCCGSNVIKQAFAYKVTNKRLKELKLQKTERYRRSYRSPANPVERITGSLIDPCLSLPTEPSEDNLAIRLLRYLLPASMLEETICLDDLKKKA